MNQSTASKINMGIKESKMQMLSFFISFLCDKKPIMKFYHIISYTALNKMAYVILSIFKTRQFQSLSFFKYASFNVYKLSSAPLGKFKISATVLNMICLAFSFKRLGEFVDLESLVPSLERISL